MCKIILAYQASTPLLVSLTAKNKLNEHFYTHRQPMALNKELFVVNELTRKKLF